MNFGTMLACERPWLRVQWSPCRNWAWPRRGLSPLGRRWARPHSSRIAKPKPSKLQLQSQNSRSEAKAQLLKYLGCFSRGSGAAADVRSLIADLELLPKPERSADLADLAGQWSLIGWIPTVLENLRVRGMLQCTASLRRHC